MHSNRQSCNPNVLLIPVSTFVALEIDKNQTNMNNKHQINFSNHLHLPDICILQNRGVTFYNGIRFDVGATSDII